MKLHREIKELKLGKEARDFLKELYAYKPSPYLIFHGTIKQFNHWVKLMLKCMSKWNHKNK